MADQPNSILGQTVRFANVALHGLDVEYLGLGAGNRFYGLAKGPDGFEWLVRQTPADLFNNLPGWVAVEALR